MNEPDLIKPSIRHTFRFLLLIIVFFSFGALAPLAYHFVTQNELFKLKNIQIITTSSQVNPQDIQRMLTTYLGQSIYRIDLENLSRKIVQLPWIKTVSIKRFPPNELKILYLEQEPIAQITLDKTYLVNEDGELFKDVNETTKYNLPLITGVNESSKQIKAKISEAQIQMAIQAIKEHSLAGSPGGKIAKININDGISLKVNFISGLNIMMGKENYDKKWLKLSKVLALLNDKQKVLEYAYLDDYPNRQQVAIRLKN